MTDPNRSLTLPSTALRAAHSGFVDYLGALPDSDVRDGLIRRAHGLTYFGFRTALLEGRFVVSARILEDDEVALTLSVPTTTMRDWTLFELDQSQHGVTAEWLDRLASVDVERTLDELLGYGGEA